jgi:glucose-6-phosphate isomerase
VEGVILGINSFDQWGVELGKELATELAPALDGSNSTTNYDLSTQNLVSKLSIE